jgi:ABC-type bacteriocin/lantibiotic exporter with double-glycine peptidase domain
MKPILKNKNAHSYELLNKGSRVKSDELDNQVKNESVGTSRNGENAESSQPKKELTLRELGKLLRPYFWPNKGSDGALINRVRACSTYLAVIASKTCSIVAPFYLSSASNDLIDGKITPAIHSMIVYISLRILTPLFKEMQNMLYVKVKQQATIELQEIIFTHIHSLSLNWHLSKQTGSVMKSMDRGIEAAQQLVTWLFLFLGPAMCECLAVVLLFFIKYNDWRLGMVVFIGVSLYFLSTIGKIETIKHSLTSKFTSKVTIL